MKCFVRTDLKKKAVCSDCEFTWNAKISSEQKHLTVLVHELQHIFQISLEVHFWQTWDQNFGWTLIQVQSFKKCAFCCNICCKKLDYFSNNPPPPKKKGVSPSYIFFGRWLTSSFNVYNVLETFFHVVLILLTNSPHIEEKTLKLILKLN